jgi:hypothetical protein
MNKPIDQTYKTMGLINRYVDAMVAYDSLKSEENYTYLEAIKQEYKEFLESTKKTKHQSF